MKQLFLLGKRQTATQTFLRPLMLCCASIRRENTVHFLMIILPFGSLLFHLRKPAFVPDAFPQLPGAVLVLLSAPGLALLDFLALPEAATFLGLVVAREVTTNETDHALVDAFLFLLPPANLLAFIGLCAYRNDSRHFPFQHSMLRSKY